MLIFGAQYFLSVENWLSLFMCGISIFLFIGQIFPSLNGCSDEQMAMKYCFAAIGNMIAFLVVMLHWSRHPLISVYTTRTFGIIAFKYLTVLLFYFPILLGFAICFHVLYKVGMPESAVLPDGMCPDDELDGRVEIWTNHGLGIFRTLTLLIDMESTDLILDINNFSKPFYRYLGFTILTMYYFFMSLVFINLLNAYAVANVAKIEKKAEDSKRISKIETILFFEKFLQTVYKALGRVGRTPWVKSYVCTKDEENIFTCMPNRNRKFNGDNEFQGHASLKSLLKWCHKKSPESNIFDQQTMKDAKERLQKDAFTTQLDRLSRTKTVYDRKSTSENVPALNSNVQSSGPTDTASINRSFDKRFRLLEAKIDHLSRLEIYNETR